MEFKIEKNIKIPPPTYNRGRPTIYPFEKMSVGDSFISSEYSRINIRRISNAARNWKFEVRKTDDNMIRIWRTQ
jgi:hypothetical protein